MKKIYLLAVSCLKTCSVKIHMRGSFLLVALLSVLAHGLYAQKFEAENFTLSNGATKTSCSACSGSYMVAEQDGNLSYNFSASSTGYVDIYIMAQTTGGNKTNILDIDGITAEFTTTATAYTRTKIASMFRLNSGAHTLKITKSWGWINIDYVELVSVAGPTYNINTSLVTANPTTEAKCLYKFLTDNYGKKIIPGVQEQADADWIKTNTGKDVVLVGNDLLFCGRGYTWYDENTPVNGVVNNYTKGGISTLCWHWRDPSRKTEEFYWQGANATYTTFDVKKINDANSAEYKAMLSDIDYMAGILKKIRDKNVPILWRPLHEAAGGWFWWGQDGPSCKKLWQIMFDRLVNYHGLKNLIWVYTKQPNDDAFYPGDAYVDIVGRDYYYTGNHTSVVNEFTDISSKFGNKKLTTISECGSFPDPDNLTKDAAYWSWFMVWGGDFVRSATYNSLDLWKKTLSHSYVYNLSTMPNIKTCSSSSTGAIPDGTYKITFKHSGLSLNVEGNVTTDGGNVIQYSYGGGRNEQWFVKNLGNSQYSIINANSGKGLDVSGSLTTNGTDINQWTYSGNNNQKWRIELVSTGYYRIVNVNSNSCVDMPGKNTAPSISIDQWGCDGGDNQSFSFTQLSTATSRDGDLEEVAGNELMVYPNPSAGSFTVKESGSFDYSIQSATGSVVEKGKGTDEVSVGKSLSSGIYILQVQSAAGTKQVKILKN